MIVQKGFQPRLRLSVALAGLLDRRLGRVPRSQYRLRFLRSGPGERFLGQGLGQQVRPPSIFGSAGQRYFHLAIRARRPNPDFQPAADLRG